jgi:hypothetical protein
MIANLAAYAIHGTPSLAFELVRLRLPDGKGKTIRQNLPATGLLD